MLSVGCCAEEIMTLILRLDFARLVQPELGSLLRAGANQGLTHSAHRPVGTQCH